MEVFYDCFILCLMQDLVARVPRDWALETSVLESGDKGICTCDIEYASFLIIFNQHRKKQGEVMKLNPR